jgi:hypothetical protein
VRAVVKKREAALKEPDAAAKEREKPKTPQPDMRRYAGTYSAAPWSGEILVLPWEDGLGMLGLPTPNPMKDIIKLKAAGEHTFRRVRKDEKLGEEIVFEMGPDGRPLRFKRHNNYYPRVKAPTP